MLDQSAGTTFGPLHSGTWNVDPEAGRIAFTIKNMWGLATVKGTFDRFEGALRISDSAVTGELIVHTESLDTKNAKRDEHLRSTDFFDAETHPRATFTTTGASTDASGIVVFGNLKVGTTTTDLEIPVDVDVDVRNPGAAVIRAKLPLARKAVGLHWNRAGMIRSHAFLDIELRLLASR